MSVGDACFSPASIGLLTIIGGMIQAAMLGLYWIGIRAKDDSIRDARELRDRVLDTNDTLARAGEVQAQQVGQVIQGRASGRGKS
jgi:hypothetical protein